MSRVVHYLDGWESHDGRARLLMLCRKSSQRQTGEDAFTTNWSWVTCPHCLDKAEHGGSDSVERENDPQNLSIPTLFTPTLRK